MSGVQQLLASLVAGLAKSDADGRWARIIQHADLGTVYLDADEVRAFDEVLDRLLRAAGDVVVADQSNMGQRFAERLLERAVLQVLCPPPGSESVAAADRIKGAILEVSSAMGRPLAKWEVHMPVLGVDEACLPYQFGPARFYTGTPRRLATLSSRALATLGTSPQPPDVVDGAKQHWREEIDRVFTGGVVAKLAVVAQDAQAAHSKAKHDLGITLDSINFLCDGFYRPHPAYVYLVGEGHARAHQNFIVLGDGTPPHAVEMSGPVIGSLALVSLERLMAGAPTRVVRRIARLLREPSTNELDKRLLSAIHWAGRAHVSPRREEASLSYAIALETLLIAQDVQLSYQLAVRVAHLLGNDAAHRARVFKRVRELYDVRSKIVHSGSYQVSKRDHDALRWYSVSGILAVLAPKKGRHLRSVAELDEWFTGKIVA